VVGPNPSTSCCTRALPSAAFFSGGGRDKSLSLPLFNYPLLLSFPNTSRRPVARSRHAPIFPLPTAATSVSIAAAEGPGDTGGWNPESSIPSIFHSIFDAHQHLRQRALRVTTMANQGNAARRRGRLLPSYAADLIVYLAAAASRWDP
jgi:hypothetical protein